MKLLLLDNSKTQNYERKQKQNRKKIKVNSEISSAKTRKIA